MERYERNLTLLKKERYGSFSVSHDTIINLSDVELTSIQKDVLCRGVDFGIPGRLGKDEILAEFEMFYQKFEHFTSHSKDAMLQFRSSLEALAHDYANKATDTRSFSLGREHAYEGLKRAQGK